MQGNQWLVQVHRKTSDGGGAAVHRATCSVIGETSAHGLMPSRAMNTNMTDVVVRGLSQDLPTAVGAVKNISGYRDALLAPNELYLSGVANDTLTT